ncbi:hypothetical protein [Pseudaestuariivita sp.]|uniref:hypothetical protein n=1 Tax=Pseudaestuariivita sp. TaxID=2211669 RepID=UPI004057EC24
MTDPKSDTPSATPSDATPPGIYRKPRRTPPGTVEIVSVILAVLWLVGSGAYVLTAGTDLDPSAGGLRFVLVALIVFLPVAMIAVAALAARASRVMREESERLHTAIDAMRQSYLSNLQTSQGAPSSALTRRLDELAQGQRKTEAMIASLPISKPDPAPAPTAEAPLAPPAGQVALELGTQVEEMEPPLPREDFVRALHFPETVEDEQGFAALRRALKHRDVSKLVQAAQDVLTLLSQDGIYMDDLRPDMAHPDVWRKFASGERGRPVAALGGVRDRSSLALTAGRMKQDPIFRDAAHHFLRMFDRNVTVFAREASDSEIQALSETRTARAFMLIGRVAGTFS